MESIFQLVLVHGEWCDYSEDVVYADADVEKVRTFRDHLKSESIATARQIAQGLIAYGQHTDLVATCIYHMENNDLGVQVRELKLGVAAAYECLESVVEQDAWALYENMTSEPYYDEYELSRYEHMAEPWEQRFLG